MEFDISGEFLKTALNSHYKEFADSTIQFDISADHGLFLAIILQTVKEHPMFEADSAQMMIEMLLEPILVEIQKISIASTHFIESIPQFGYRFGDLHPDRMSTMFFIKKSNEIALRRCAEAEGKPLEQVTDEATTEAERCIPTQGEITKLVQGLDTTIDKYCLIKSAALCPELKGRWCVGFFYSSGSAMSFFVSGQYSNRAEAFAVAACLSRANATEKWRILYLQN